MGRLSHNALGSVKLGSVKLGCAQQNALFTGFTELDTFISTQLPSERLILAGSLDVQAVDSTLNGSMQLAIRGEAVTGYRDGQPLGLATPAPPQPGTMAWIAASTVLAAAGLFLLWWIPLLQYRIHPDTQGLSRRKRHAWIYHQRGLARYRQARFLRAWAWASLAMLLDARAKHVPNYGARPP